MNDIFSAGVVLFIMSAAHPPFYNANAEDDHYKLLIRSRDDLFWKAH
jgi:hypothetical protein